MTTIDTNGALHDAIGQYANKNTSSAGYDLYPGPAGEIDLSKKDVYAIGAGIAMLAGGVAGCSVGQGMGPDTSIPPAVVAVTQSPGPAASSTPTPHPSPSTGAAATIKEGATSDGRAFKSLKPGDTVALADYVGALRAGVKMFRFEDGSAAVLGDSGDLPESVVSFISTGLSDGLPLSQTQSLDVLGRIQSSPVRAFVVVPFYHNETPSGWIVARSNLPDVSPTTTDMASATIEGAIAARQADIDAHPDVVIIGPNGVIPRG